MALTATIFLLSLTGVPLTAGFQSKFFMLMAAVENGHQFWIVIVAVLFAAISAYYYFRIIQAMYFKDANENTITTTTITQPFLYMLMLIALMIVIIGIYPEIIIGWMYR
jgi:NADH-quinone oxidoreductase subunit N